MTSVLSCNSGDLILHLVSALTFFFAPETSTSFHTVRPDVALRLPAVCAVLEQQTHKWSVSADVTCDLNGFGMLKLLYDWKIYCCPWLFNFFK